MKFITLPLTKKKKKVERDPHINLKTKHGV